MVGIELADIFILVVVHKFNSSVIVSIELFNTLAPWCRNI